MTTRRASELILAVDFPSASKFSVVGVMREPTLALNVAVRDLQTYRENVELHPVVVHGLAMRVAGRCQIRNSFFRQALLDCVESRLALEWKIQVPTIGVLRAVFLIARFEETNRPDLFDLVLHLAGKPSFESAQPQASAHSRQGCSLLRFL